MQKFTKQTDFASLADTASDGPESAPAAHDSLNDEMVGRPITGRTRQDLNDNADKYSIFGSEGIGEHFGRSGSPKGSSPKI